MRIDLALPTFIFIPAFLASLARSLSFSCISIHVWGRKQMSRRSRGPRADYKYPIGFLFLYYNGRILRLYQARIMRNRVFITKKLCEVFCMKVWLFPLYWVNCGVSLILVRYQIEGYVERSIRSIFRYLGVLEISSPVLFCENINKLCRTS